MKAIIIAISFIGCMTIVNAQLLTAAVIIIGAKILIGKGFIYGAAKGAIARNLATGGGRGRGRHGREAEAADFNSVLLEQNQKDVDECAKLLVCALNAKPLNKLDVSLGLVFAPLLADVSRKLRLACKRYKSLCFPLHIQLNKSLEPEQFF